MPKTISNGFLVVFEGIDGVGKSTQLGLAKKELVKAGWPAKTSRNLGGTEIGEKLREVIKSPSPRPPETNMYISAAIQEALIGAVAEDRHHGKLILMDRGPLSLAAYEIFGSGVDGALAWPHVDRGMTALKPDLVIIYEVNIRKALGRAKQHSTKPDYFESKPLEYFDKVAKGYKAASERYANIVFIDAGGSTDTVHKQTMIEIMGALTKHA